MLLLPQLPTPYAIHLAKELCALSVDECLARRAITDTHRYFTPTGGTPIGDDKYELVRDQLIVRAEKVGYPQDSAEARLRFDAEAAIYLHKELTISDNEAAKEGVWNFLCCVAAPDLVRWRWLREGKEVPLTRFLAGPKNTFQRLWWRAKAYHDSDAADPCWLLRKIGEDESVGIMERTALSGIRPLVVTVLKSLITTHEISPFIPRSELMREGMKRLRRIGSIVALETLDREERATLCNSVFSECITARGYRPKSETARTDDLEFPDFLNRANRRSVPRRREEA